MDKCQLQRGINVKKKVLVSNPSLVPFVRNGRDAIFEIIVYPPVVVFVSRTKQLATLSILKVRDRGRIVNKWPTSKASEFEKNGSSRYSCPLED